MPLTCRINTRLGKLNMRSAAAAGGRKRKGQASEGRSFLTSFGILVAEGQSVAAAAAAAAVKRKNCSFCEG